MVSNINQFVEELIDQNEALKEAITDIIKDTTNEIYTALLEPKSVGGTPRITGHLRSNYIVTVDSRFTGIVGSRESVSTGRRDNAIRQFLNIQDLTNRDEININNNVPYGPIVNSRQRFREGAIQRGTARLNRNRTVRI